MKNLELWYKIAAFPLNDEGATFAFSQKLAKEQRWSSNFTVIMAQLVVFCVSN